MMKQQKPGTDSFATFLENLKRREEQSQQAPGGASLKLLTILKESAPLPVPELMAKSGMGFAEFTEALKVMRDVGLIALTGQAGRETAELTPNGKEIAARLAT